MLHAYGQAYIGLPTYNLPPQWITMFCSKSSVQEDADYDETEKEENAGGGGYVRWSTGATWMQEQTFIDNSNFFFQKK